MSEKRSVADMPEEVQQGLHRYADALEAGFYSEADELAAEVMEQIAQHAAAALQDDPDFQEVMLASGHEQAGEWEEARKIYERRIRRIVRSSIDRGALVELAGCNRELAWHHWKVGELNLGAMYAAEATHAGRSLGMDDIVLPSHLMLEGQLANRQQRFAAARQHYDEALTLLSDSAGFNLFRAKLLTGRSESHWGLGNWDRALRDHDRAWELLAPQAVMELAFGVQCALREWWMLGAAFWEDEGDLEQAAHGWLQSREHVRRSVELWDEGGVDSLLPQARWLVRYGDFLMRTGEPDVAAGQYAESDSIRRRFNLPTIPRQLPHQ